jgi:hypothetical protein
MVAQPNGTGQTNRRILCESIPGWVCVLLSGGFVLFSLAWQPYKFTRGAVHQFARLACGGGQGWGGVWALEHSARFDVCARAHGRTGRAAPKHGARPPCDLGELPKTWSSWLAETGRAGAACGRMSTAHASACVRGHTVALVARHQNLRAHTVVYGVLYVLRTCVSCLLADDQCSSWCFVRRWTRPRLSLGLSSLAWMFGILRSANT